MRDEKQILVALVLNAAEAAADQLELTGVDEPEGIVEGRIIGAASAISAAYELDEKMVLDAVYHVAPIFVQTRRQSGR